MAPGRAKEMLGAGIFFLIAVIAYVEVGKVQRLGYDSLGEAAFPRMIAAVTGVSAIILFVQAFIRRTVPAKDRTGIGRSKLVQAIAAFVLFALFALNVFSGWVPFPLSGVIFCLVIGLIYIEQVNRASIIGLIAVAIIFPTALDWIFRVQFFVEMP